MNPNIWISWITTGIGLAGGAAVDHGIVNASTETAIVGALVALVPVAWGAFIHRDSKVVEMASIVPGVEPIKVDTRAAASAVAALANDDSVKTVQPVATTQRR